MKNILYVHYWSYIGIPVKCELVYLGSSGQYGEKIGWLKLRGI